MNGTTKFFILGILIILFAGYWSYRSETSAPFLRDSLKQNAPTAVTVQKKVNPSADNEDRQDLSAQVQEEPVQLTSLPQKTSSFTSLDDRYKEDNRPLGEDGMPKEETASPKPKQFEAAPQRSFIPYSQGLNVKRHKTL